ncbi:MAG: Asp-tRNA(Asn)/Glu-tRNA(Gln) amidotransferase subunit GatA [Oscillospiraceae bacterium]
MKLNELAATELIELLSNKECSALEIIEDTFREIERKEPEMEAFITLTKEAALKNAKRVDEKIASGGELGSLAGIPIAVKDNICTKGVRTTAASKMLENFVPTYNATVVEKLNAADAIMVGKANLDEFAMGSSCETSAFKKTKNPHNIEYVPGGSSGGSAAAVAASESVLALGSDTGGSVRLPASFCGVVGLRPTYGAVSRYGLLPLASSFDQVGPLGRTVADVELLFNVISGKDPKDSTTVDFKTQNHPIFDVKKLKIGVPEEYFGDFIDEEVKKSVFEMIEFFKKSGAQIKKVNVSHMEYMLPIYSVVLTIEAASNLARYDGMCFGLRAKEFKDLEEMYANTREEGFGDEVKRRIILGTFLSSSESGSAYMQRAIVAKNELLKAHDELFKLCDILITPTGPTQAFRLGGICDPIKMYAMDLCTLAPSILGLPAISVPCGKGQNNLPIGAQLIGQRYCEQLLFEAGKCFERNSL